MLPSHAQVPTPSPTPFALSGIFNNKGTLGLDSVRSAALAQSTATPYYKSNGLETRYYEGYFKAATNTSKLALLSDDGTSVWIDGTQVLNRAGQGQGFDQLGANTFYPLSKSFTAGQIYHLRLQYTNTYHLSDADIDGVSLWAYDGGGSVAVPTLTVSADKTVICAGGWNNTRHAYEYLVKETGQWKQRNEKPDPHIATLTATVKVEGQPVSGQPVTFSWDMPGPAPAETRTVTTDSNGKAIVDVVSGDELSTDTDDDSGQVLFNSPVPVKIQFWGGQATQNLDVKNPSITWQYKNEAGNYVAWAGETDGLYSRASQQMNIPLRALLTFGNVPVIGHPVSWEIAQVLDKSGEEVPSSDSDYPTYGQLSGAISTSAADGGATATFSPGYNVGQLVFDIADANVYTR